MGIFLEVESLEVAMPSSCSYDAGAASGWWMLVVEISKQQKGDFLLVSPCILTWVPITLPAASFAEQARICTFLLRALILECCKCDFITEVF